MASFHTEHWLTEEDDATIRIPTFGLISDCSATPSPSISPNETDFDPFFLPLCTEQHNYASPLPSFTYHMPALPSNFSLTDNSPACSPRPPLPDLTLPPAEQVHVTSGVTKISVCQPPKRPAHPDGHVTYTFSPDQRRRAQNRAAQRAFRERKEKRAKDLEVQLLALTEKCRALESSYAELNASYEKLRKMMEVLMKGEGEKPLENGDLLRNLLMYCTEGMKLEERSKAVEGN